MGYPFNIQSKQISVISVFIFKQYIILFNHLKLTCLEVCFMSQIKLLKLRVIMSNILFLINIKLHNIYKFLC